MNAFSNWPNFILWIMSVQISFEVTVTKLKHVLYFWTFGIFHIQYSVVINVPLYIFDKSKNELDSSATFITYDLLYSVCTKLIQFNDLTCAILLANWPSMDQKGFRKNANAITNAHAITYILLIFMPRSYTFDNAYIPYFLFMKSCLQYKKLIFATFPQV